MKKGDFDKKYIQIAILAILVIICSILFEQVIGNMDLIYDSIRKTFGFLTALVNPFLIGFAIAYILNPAERYFENSKFIANAKFLSTPKKKRMAGLLLTYIIAILFMIIVISAVVPSVIENVNALLTSLPSSINQIRYFATEYMQKNGDGANSLINTVNELTNENYNTTQIMNTFLKSLSQIFYSLPDVLSSVLGGFMSLASGVLNFVLGFVISIYMLMDKDYFAKQTKKIVLVLTNKSFAQKTFKISKMANNTLEKFIVGKAIDSFIIGSIFFVICVILKVPYAPLFGLIIGITNMIPYFGPFIGAVPVLFITLIWNYHMFLPIGIAILVIQQFDGIILGPKILGDSIGLKPISIIFAILIGGGLFGVLGMFLGAPVYAVIATIVNGILDRNYDKKNVQ